MRINLHKKIALWLQQGLPQPFLSSFNLQTFISKQIHSPLLTDAFHQSEQKLVTQVDIEEISQIATDQARVLTQADVAIICLFNDQLLSQQAMSIPAHLAGEVAPIEEPCPIS